MADNQVASLINAVANNPDILKNIPELAGEKAKELLNILSPDILKTIPDITQKILNTDIISAVNTTASSDNITNSLGSISYFYSIQYIIIISIVLWGIMLILTRFLVKEEEIKKDIEFVNNLLIGNIGIIPIITSIWIIGILGVTLIPTLVNVMPKIGGLSSVMSSFFSTMITQLPNLFKK